MITGQSIAQQSINNIRDKKLQISPNAELIQRIKLLQREMVKMSFQNNRKEDINLVVNEISRLRSLMKSP